MYVNIDLFIKLLLSLISIMFLFVIWYFKTYVVDELKRIRVNLVKLKNHVRIQNHRIDKLERHEGGQWDHREDIEG